MANENFTSKLPEKFARNVVGACGAAGASWIENLPGTVAEIAENWSLEIGEPFPNLSYNFVAPCRSADADAVLKIGLPEDNPEIFCEAGFLRAAKGAGAVRLLKFDPNRRAMLLERLTPGEHLKAHFSREKCAALQAAISVMRTIYRAPPGDGKFGRLDEWLENFFRKSRRTNFPAEARNKARKFYESLTCRTEKFLIHGDLHHENVLSARRAAFLAIDPKGVVGDIGYDIAVFLNNHLRWLACEPQVRQRMNDAVREFSEAFEIEPPEVRKWAFVQSVLSAWWTFEENSQNWEPELALAEFWEV